MSALAQSSPDGCRGVCCRTTHPMPPGEECQPAGPRPLGKAHSQGVGASGGSWGATEQETGVSQRSPSQNSYLLHHERYLYYCTGTLCAKVRRRMPALCENLCNTARPGEEPCDEDWLCTGVNRGATS